MGRENKKETVAALHRDKILTAAEQIFFEKGFEETTISDISKASQYSRRTLYAYFDSKEDIRNHLIARGLFTLKQDISNALQNHSDFLSQYFSICHAMQKYHIECPYSMESVNAAKTSLIDFNNLSPAVTQIFSLGTEINSLLESFIQTGQKQGVVLQTVLPMQTVYILWSSLSALFTLIQTKGVFIAKAFSMTEEAYLDYGLKQIINSILEVRI